MNLGTTPAIWVDGQRASSLPLPDRGLDFGDGLFETLLLRQGRPLFPDLHLDRLANGLQRLAFPDCLETAREHLFAAAEELDHWEWGALRLTVTRGAAPRGYAPPPEAHPRVVITAAPLARDCRQFPAPLVLAIASVRWSTQPLLAGLKHLNRLEQVLAAGEADAAGCDDVLMLDIDGGVCSTSSANLFLVESGRLVTPGLDHCGIAGTRRRLVCERLAEVEGLEVDQQAVSLSRVMAADEVFCCNSLRGIQAVARIGETGWQQFPVSAALHQRLVEAMQC